MTAYLKIDQLTKRFGSFTALSDISLQVNEGEFVCFLGPSGCGKTTLLRAIAGLELQDKGSIIQGGQDISALPPQQRDFGIVFQSYALFPNLNVANNIAYGLVNKKLDRGERQRRVSQLLEQIDLPGIEEKFPGQLSGGQQQRVALARALATEPNLLLLDEPLSALDARVRLHLRQEIRDLQQKLGITTIMVTHDQDEALTMADRIVVMDHGSIAQIGTPEEIYNRPATAFVARFIGTMNLLPVRVLETGSIMLGTVEANMPLPVASNQQGLLGFRPESAQVSSLPLYSDSDQLQLSGTIRHISFMGAFVRVGIEVTQQVTVKIDLQVSELTELQPEIGQQLYISICAQALHFYPQQQDQAEVSVAVASATTQPQSSDQIVLEAS